MSTPTAYAFDRQRIFVAEEDSFTAAMVVATLRRDGHCVTHDPGGLSALDPEVEQCHLLISSLQHGGDLPRVDLLEDLRQQLPSLPILYLASAADATAVPEAQLPRDVQVLRSPFTSAELRAAVRRLLPQLGAGTVLARPMVEPTTVTDILELPGGASAPEETNA